MNEKNLLTLYEAERERNIPYHTLRRLIDSGDLPAVKLPGRRRKFIDLCDLDALIERSKTGKKLDQQIDHSHEKTSAKTKQNERPLKMVKSGQNAVKPNWYKDF